MRVYKDKHTAYTSVPGTIRVGAISGIQGGQPQKALVINLAAITFCQAHGYIQAAKRHVTALSWYQMVGEKRHVCVCQRLA